MIHAVSSFQWKHCGKYSLKVFFSEHRRLSFPSEKLREPTFEVLDTSVFYPLVEMKVHTTSSVLFNYLIKIVQNEKY